MICTRCDLHKTRRCITKIAGTENPDLLFLAPYPSVAGEIQGVTYSVHEIKIIETLLSEASEILNIPLPTFQCLSIVLCRPTSSKFGATREPHKEEVLACMGNIISIISVAKPKKIILIGNLTQKFYGKEYPEAVMIQSLELLLRQGGPISAWFNMNVRSLSEVLKTINKK